MSIDNSYPKVLIIGETFRLNGGGGITLINLFKNWNTDNLAIVTEKINETSFESGCKKFYRLGNLEIKMPFPFNLINKIDPSGDISPTEQIRNISILTQPKRKLRQSIKYSVEMAYYKILFLLGLYHANYKISISEQLLKWIEEFSPDIIYTQPFKYSDMVFAIELKRKTGIPLAIHLMDDSVSFLNHPNLLYFYWKSRINNTFKQLVENADIHLSVSQTMAEEYTKRYNKTFIPFRNPIDIDSWEPHIKKDWSLNGEVKIIYTGRLAMPNIDSLYTFCKVVNRLYSAGYKIKLDIYSIDNNSEFNAKIHNFKPVVLHKAVSFDKIPALITKSDIAFLPIDFTRKGLRYAKYSLSTKTSEYMISGVPILLFAPKEVALTSYAETNNCMYSVTDNNLDVLSEALMEFIKNKDLRASLAQKAISVAESDSNALLVRKKFRETLNSGIRIKV